MKAVPHLVPKHHIIRFDAAHICQFIRAGKQKLFKRCAIPQILYGMLFSIFPTEGFILAIRVDKRKNFGSKLLLNLCGGHLSILQGIM